jgi:monothiol glutaredoxin
MQDQLIFTKIDNLVKNNNVVLFMKGNAEMPLCGFSARVAAILNHLKVEFVGVNILEDEAIRQAIKDYSEWPTIPQLYVKGIFIGGCDITKDMFEKGELQKLFISHRLIS